MNEQIAQVIADLQGVYPEVRNKIDSQRQRIAELEQDNGQLQARVQNAESGLPPDSITPTQVADLAALRDSFRELLAL